MPGRKSLPDTLKRSPRKAQRTWIKAHDSAIEEYGEGERAHRTAFAALKRSKKSAAQARRGEGETFGGIDYYGSTKDQLYERARKLHVAGRSGMSKKELARAIARRQ